MINLLVLKETLESEKRVALVPDEIKKYSDIGFKVTIEKDAGIKSGFLNEDYKKQNANISQNIKESIKESDIIIKVQKPEPSIIKEIKAGTILIGLLSPKKNSSEKPDLIPASFSIVTLKPSSKYFLISSGTNATLFSLSTVSFKTKRFIIIIRYKIKE